MEYLAYAFDHTLSGPFNKLLSVWFSSSQTLCTAHFLFLSPLQRFEVLLCYLIIALLYNAFFHLSSIHFLFFFDYPEVYEGYLDVTNLSVISGCFL